MRYLIFKLSFGHLNIFQVKFNQCSCVLTEKSKFVYEGICCLALEYFVKRFVRMQFNELEECGPIKSFKIIFIHIYPFVLSLCLFHFISK